MHDIGTHTTTAAVNPFLDLVQVRLDEPLRDRHSRRIRAALT